MRHSFCNVRYSRKLFIAIFGHRILGLESWGVAAVMTRIAKHPRGINWWNNSPFSPYILWKLHEWWWIMNQVMLTIICNRILSKWFTRTMIWVPILQLEKYVLRHKTSCKVVNTRAVPVSTLAASVQNHRSIVYSVVYLCSSVVYWVYITCTSHWHDMLFF